MSSSVESIFELSLSEKLQLVEDVWDDIASSLEAVPVYDWQNEELARRKQNLVNSPRLSPFLGRNSEPGSRSIWALN
jgi:putative addiction module component (TIGR02574 family)